MPRKEGGPPLPVVFTARANGETVHMSGDHDRTEDEEQRIRKDCAPLPNPTMGHFLAPVASVLSQ